MQTIPLWRACSADGDTALRLCRARHACGERFSRAANANCNPERNSKRRAGDADPERSAGDDGNSSNADHCAQPHPQRPHHVFQLCGSDLV